MKLRLAILVVTLLLLGGSEQLRNNGFRIVLTQDRIVENVYGWGYMITYIRPMQDPHVFFYKWDEASIDLALNQSTTKLYSGIRVIFESFEVDPITLAYTAILWIEPVPVNATQERVANLS